jgi:hypothetical protein
MSMPISICEVYKAAKGDESAFQFVAMAMEYNMTQPAHTIMGCMCKPSCTEPTEQQKKNLSARLEEYMKAAAAKRKL